MSFQIIFFVEHAGGYRNVEELRLKNASED